MKALASALLLSLAFTTAAHAARTPDLLVEYPNQAVVTGSGNAVTAEQVKQAIADAATLRRWQVSYAPKGGLIEASMTWKRHTIVVAIPYDSTAFSITYRDSVNMNYGDYIPMETYGGGSHPYNVQRDATGKAIHPLYNRRVEELLAGIRANLRKL